ncbi:MAG: SRPBCC family protein [Planctomycetes bacterium]|nr:SRPBCC family protein [Planctomycetota bacterium]
MILYIVLAIFGLIVLLIGALGIIGSFLPATHTATMSVTVAMPREKVWALLDDVSAFPTWLPGIDKIEMLPDHDGHRVFRQQQGRNSFVLEETVKTPPSLVTRTIADDNGMFSGRWEHRFEDAGSGGTRITVTETGTVNSAIPRAIMRLFTGYDFYLTKFGEALKVKCGA